MAVDVPLGRSRRAALSQRKLVPKDRLGSNNSKQCFGLHNSNSVQKEKWATKFNYNNVQTQIGDLLYN